MKTKLLLFIFIIISSTNAFTQPGKGKGKHRQNSNYISTNYVSKPADSSSSGKKFLRSNIILFSGGIGEDHALCDMAQRYGFNTNLNLAFHYYTSKGIVLGLEFNYIFGRDLQGESLHIFDNIKTSNGQIINMYGEYSQYYLAERGFFTGIKAGYMHKISKNKANKIYSTISAGFFQHKIFISVDGNNTQQIQGEYAKGYDRLTNGLATKLFLGYAYLPVYSPINFYVGLEFYYARTYNRRAINFDTMQQETAPRNDCLIGINAGWFIPIYKRDVKKYYYIY